jgi:hypothetical protein
MPATNGNGSAVKGLTPEQIKELLGKTRNRGGYIAPLDSFMESDEAVINVVDNFPMFSEKVASTLYQGFLNAVKKAKLEDTVRVIKSGDDVFLAHNERLAQIEA